MDNEQSTMVDPVLATPAETTEQVDTAPTPTESVPTSAPTLMSAPLPSPTVAAPPIPNGTPQTQPADIEMTDSALPTVAEPTPQPPPPYAAAVTTPTPTTPAMPPVTSARNSPHPPIQTPTQAHPHGSPTRVYLNQHVTPYLLEAMKHLVTTEPEKPLKWLSEYLAQKSAEIEG